jgi:hypothetical protein
VGFGYLLIGYIFTFLFSLSNVYFFADIIGTILMMIGLSKLSWHGKNFLRAMQVDILLLVLCFARALLMIFRIITGEGILATAMTVAIAAVGLVLQFFIFAGIHYLAMDVELEKESIRAKRSILLVFTYYILHIAVLLIGPALGNTVGNIAALCIFLYGLIALLFNTVLIHSCYCRICLKGQENGERTRSKYEWVNRWNEKTDSILDNAYMRKKSPEKESEEDPGYMRVKRKKNKRK